MTRYVTEHRLDPDRAIRFITQYCKVWNPANNVYVREHFEHNISPTDFKYIYVHDDSSNVGTTLEPLPIDEYISFEEVKGRRCL